MTSAAGGWRSGWAISPRASDGARNAFMLKFACYTRQTIRFITKFYLDDKPYSSSIRFTALIVQLLGTTRFVYNLVAALIMFFLT